MSLHNLVADIVSRVPAMYADSATNNEMLLEQLIKAYIEDTYGRKETTPEHENPALCFHPVIADGTCIDCGHVFAQKLPKPLVT